MGAGQPAPTVTPATRTAGAVGVESDVPAATRRYVVTDEAADPFFGAQGLHAVGVSGPGAAPPLPGPLILWRSTWRSTTGPVACCRSSPLSWGRLEWRPRKPPLGWERPTTPEPSPIVGEGPEHGHRASQAAGPLMLGQGYRRSSASARRPGRWRCRTSRSTARPRRRSPTSPSVWRWVATDHREHRGPDLHPHPEDRARPGRPGVPRRGRGADRRAAPHRRADGRRRRRGVPGLPGRRPDHRHDPARRRRLDGTVGRRDRPGRRAGCQASATGAVSRAGMRRDCWRRQAR